MAYRLQTIDPATRFVDLLSIDLFAQLLPHSQILAILHTTRRREQRVRKRSQAVIVWLIIAMNIWTHVSLAHVFQKLARGLRFVWPDPTMSRTGRLGRGGGPLVGGTRTAAFPVGIALGFSWNVDLLRDVGRALAHEAHDKGAGVLLAPTLNLFRSTLNGRNDAWRVPDLRRALCLLHLSAALSRRRDPRRWG